MHQFAFGEKVEQSKIYVSDQANLCAMRRHMAGGKIISVQDVPVTTVDAFSENNEPPNFIRMDVEGYEYEIFLGMNQALKNDIKILVELHTPFLKEKLGEILGILKQNGFAVRFVVFEDKTQENRVIRVLMRKAGHKLPVFASNISIDELGVLMEKHAGDSPCVLFEKVSLLK
jgi:hypothetical protein